MKFLMLVVFVAFQTIFSSVVLAWSPLDVYESLVEPSQLCYSVTASGEEEKKQECAEGEECEEDEEEEEEEEEEPDCE